MSLVWSWVSLLSIHANNKGTDASCVMRKIRLSAYAKTKPQISCAVTAQLISVFVFVTQIVQSLCFLNPKFQASSHFLWLYSPVSVRAYRNPEEQFSHNEAHAIHRSLISPFVVCCLDSKMTIVIYSKFQDSSHCLWQSKLV